jgi:hypothetical protein
MIADVLGSNGFPVPSIPVAVNPAGDTNGATAITKSFIDRAA